MSDKPIIFSAPMVRALLDGRKTQTRRIVKLADDLRDKEYTGDLVSYYGDHRLGMAFNGTTRVQPIRFAPGDRLYVREAHYLTDDGTSEYAVYAENSTDVSEHFRQMHDIMASHPSIDWSKHLRLRPSIHMPRWASRLTLAVTDVRVQRLQEIGEADAKAEGVKPDRSGGGMAGMYSPMGAGPFAYARGFRDLWNSLHGPDAWDADPWVVALTFDVHRCNIDEMEAAA